MNTELKTAKILLADDEPDMVSIVSRSLRISGYDVIVAGDGLECCDLAEAERPDVILLDNVMPNMDGPAAMERLRATESTCDIPIIIVTAQADSGSLAAALRAGADAYIIKPFEYGTLLEKIAAVLESPQPSAKA
ncbi:MAG: response regulator [Phycisphaerae bacterium]|nr:response regulator [Phycisphaerae bacterium]